MHQCAYCYKRTTPEKAAGEHWRELVLRKLNEDGTVVEWSWLACLTCIPKAPPPGTPMGKMHVPLIAKRTEITRRR